jgi:GTP-binding protein LepA
LLEDIKKLINCEEKDIHLISAKFGTGVEKLLDDVIEKIPAPKVLSNKPLALIFDSHYDPHKGIILHVRIFGGRFKKFENYYLKAKNYRFRALEVGYFTPELKECEYLQEGEIGYIATGIKELEIVNIGDSVVQDLNQEPIPGYQEPIPVVFASIYPSENITFEKFSENLKKMRLNDPAVRLESCYSSVFGRGFIIGCLGLLHLEIFQERLKREFSTDVILTLPSIKYKVLLDNGKEIFIQNADQLPDPSKIKKILEPWVKIHIYSPLKYVEDISLIIKKHRGIITNRKFYESFIELEGELPLEELITGFYDELKSVSSGYASLSYEFLEYREGDLVKLDILIAEAKYPGLSRIVPREKAEIIGRKIVKELKNLLPREQFPIKLQAAIGGKIIARETIPALKADVAGWLYGGDITRKIKLWQKQKRGKKKLEKLGKGKVKVPNDVLIKILKLK